MLLHPADLDDYLNMARAGPSVSDEQHIYNKLLFDAINEGITECIVDVSLASSLHLFTQLLAMCSVLLISKVVSA